MINANTRLVDLTLGELVEYLGIKPIKEEPKEQPLALIFKIQGLADFLGVSYGTAVNLKNGKLRPATLQIGRVVAFDKAKVIEIMSKK